MAVVIGPLEFEGPYSDAGELDDIPGVYALFCEHNGEYEFLELDENKSLKCCLDADEFTSNLRFLEETSRGKIVAAVHYTPDLNAEQRQQIKLSLLTEFS